MISLAMFVTPASPCGYLPGEMWQFDYEIVVEASRDDYERRLLSGWRRFGRSMFRPRCRHCSECRSYRVSASGFQPNRSQRRNRTLNEANVRLVIDVPSVTPEKLELYDRFHSHQVERVGWPEHGPKEYADYHESFVDNPFPAEEWRYYVADRLVGVGYVDEVSVGLSAIYFYHDPDFRDRGLGTWNVQCVIDEARKRGLPHAYLGYRIRGCRSSEYKGRFRPAEEHDLDSLEWRPAEE